MRGHCDEIALNRDLSDGAGSFIAHYAMQFQGFVKRNRPRLSI